ncbi:MAG: radical SAM protein [Acidobacteria bacterium]|nr:radical SAM protein [Acidobacteriota bacterium]
MSALLTFLRLQTRGVPPPAEWMLEVTNRCNLRCPMCLRDKVKFRSRDMDMQFIRRLLENNPPPFSIWPYGYGESLLYKGLFEFVRYARSKGILTSLSTNGTHLTDDANRKLLSSGLDYLIVAFDGATPETYAYHRRGADFHHVKANVERLLALKLEAKSQLHITLQMILTRRTAAEVQAFRRLWNRPGVDCVRIREDLSERSCVAGHDEGSPEQRPCFFLWRGPLFIQAGGTVIPCPYYHGANPVGDLKSQTVDEVWNSENMMELRQAHVSGDLRRFPICASCPRYQPHWLIAAASFLVTTRGIRTYIPIAERIQQTIGHRFFA